MRARPLLSAAVGGALAAMSLVYGCFLPSFDKIDDGKGSTSGSSKAASGPGAGGSAGAGGAMGGASSVGPGGAGGAGGGGAGVGGCAPPEKDPADAGADKCAGHPGPTMVHAGIKGGGTYCIDTTEVTNQQYDAFLQANVPVSGQEPHCAWNMDFTPMGWTGVPLGQEKVPVVSVDWCDAQAYCKFVGKRLCGKVGGGPASYGTPPDEVNEQWYRSCNLGLGKARPYPYGTTYEPKTCNGVDYGAGVPIVAGIATACEGGYCGMFDMAGNVAEWVDICEAYAGQADKCYALGGSFLDNEMSASCVGTIDQPRDTVAANIGFRCCVD